MFTVNPVYKLSNVSDDLKWTTNTHVKLFTFTFKAISMVLEDFFAPSFFYPSTHISTRPYSFLRVDGSLHKVMRCQLQIHFPGVI